MREFYVLRFRRRAVLLAAFGTQFPPAPRHFAIIPSQHQIRTSADQ